MAAPSLPIIDSFDRADGTLDGDVCSDGLHQWAIGRAFGTGGGTQLNIVSNVVVGDGVPGDGYLTSDFTANAEAYCTLTTKPPIGNFAAGLFLRVTSEHTTVYNTYKCQWAWEGANFVSRISRIVAGVGTNIDNNVSAVNDGDKIGFQVIGTTLIAWEYVGGVWNALTTAIDSTLAGTGHMAIQVDDLAAIDDLGGGSLGPFSSGDDPPQHILGRGAC